MHETITFSIEKSGWHEEEMQREMEERRRKEIEEEEMRKFKALHIFKEYEHVFIYIGTLFQFPRKSEPLTEVQEYNLHVDNRAVDRAEFYKKMKEKEMVHKRYREEAEAAKMVYREMVCILDLTNFPYCIADGGGEGL
ncbi:hypothetical protein ACS0TY_000212 [Phlomoides rotata]